MNPPFRDRTARWWHTPALDDPVGSLLMIVAVVYVVGGLFVLVARRWTP